MHRNMKLLGYKDRSEEAFNDFMWQCLLGASTAMPVKDYHLMATEAYASYLWKYKRCHHYYLDDGVADFCSKSVKELTEKFYKPLPEPESIVVEVVPKWIQASIAVNDDYTLKSGIVVHFPSKERMRSLLIVQRPALRHSKKFGYNPNHGERSLCSIVDGEDIVMPCGFDSGINCFDDDNAQDWIARLVFGLGLYIDAFPDSVTPSDAIGQIATTVQPQCFNIGKSETMKFENTNAVSPHYRRGHFRLLQDDRYKNKKGQSIFIRGSFVKGQAFDIQ